MESPSSKTVKCSRGLSPDERFNMNMGEALYDNYCSEDDEKTKKNTQDDILFLIESFSRLDENNSPIERILWAEILFIVDGYNTVKSLDFPEDHSEFITWVSPQYVVEKYTVDFMFEIRCHGRQKRIIVECDGHEFHEKTKEQAKHDKKRDRFFARRDTLVLRFTGSEIYNNPKECAEEIGDTLYGIMSGFVREHIAEGV